MILIVNSIRLCAPIFFIFSELTQNSIIYSVFYQDQDSEATAPTTFYYAIQRLKKMIESPCIIIEIHLKQYKSLESIAWKMIKDMTALSFLEIPDQQTISSMMNEKPLLASFIKLDPLQKSGCVLATLYQSCLKLEGPQISNSGQEPNVLVVNINFSIKYDVIEMNGQKRGFLLLESSKNQKDCQNLMIYFDHPLIASKWIAYLHQKINQDNFHSKFEAVKKLGSGNFAKVYEVIRKQDGEKFAVKAFSKGHLRNSDKGLQALRAEISILRSLSHQNILKFEGVFESANSIYIVLEYLSGQNLLDFIKQRKSMISPSQVRNIMNGILNGLSHLQSIKIAHRDIKLENIVMRDKDGLVPVIVDFGLSVFSDQTSYLFERCGTPGYVPPEIIFFQKDRKINSKCDVFSAGILFHILLTGRPLFRGETGEEVYQNNKNLNISLQHLYIQGVDGMAINLLSKMLVVNPEERISAKSCLEHGYFCQKTDIIQTEEGQSCDFNIDIEQ